MDIRHAPLRDRPMEANPLYCATGRTSPGLTAADSRCRDLDQINQSEKGNQAQNSRRVATDAMREARLLGGQPSTLLLFLGLPSSVELPVPSSVGWAGLGWAGDVPFKIQKMEKGTRCAKCVLIPAVGLTSSRLVFVHARTYCRKAAGS